MHHLVVKMSPKKIVKKKHPSCQYEAEVAWRAPDLDEVFALKEFLKGKALLIIRKRLKKEIEEESRAEPQSLHLTVMNLHRTLKPKQIHKKGIQIDLDQTFSDQRSVVNINSALVTGKHGNIVILMVNNLRKAILRMLTFSPNGTKVLTRSDAKANIGGWSCLPHFDLKASPGSRFVYLCSLNREIFVYEILNERKILLRDKYFFEDWALRSSRSMSGYLSHIFCYSEDKLIVLINYSNEPDVKFMVFTFDEEKGKLVRGRVKNWVDFDFRGQIKFYQKNGRVYFFDQKQSIYRLTLS